HNLETMTLNRRNFLAASAALASAPALGAASASGETDVAIVGAGAAGIAAARKVAAAGRRFALIEASDHVGGRCVTDTRIFGVPCMQALPKALGGLRTSVEFVLGPFGCGKYLDEISAVDFARSLERDVDAFCRQGLGALLAKVAADLPVQLNAPVARMQSLRNGVEIETARGRITARAAIVPVSNGVLDAGKIKFAPDLPKRHTDA